MTSTVEPSPTASWQPDIRITGDASAAVIWVGVVLIALALMAMFRPRGSNAE